jgi:hypothetical protein
MMSANFPAGLSIFHSDSSSHTQAEALTDVLSAEAQDTAIAKYGIAGRVWYIRPTLRSAPLEPPQGGGLCNDALRPGIERV